MTQPSAAGSEGLSLRDGHTGDTLPVRITMETLPPSSPPPPGIVREVPSSRARRAHEPVAIGLAQARLTYEDWVSGEGIVDRG
jgi:hypothetical protein